MSTSNGAASSDIDPIILKQFLADGLGWIVADEIDAEYLQAHGFAALLHIDGMPLLRKDVQSRDQLVVLSRPDEAGAEHAGQIKERLVEIKWAGTLSYATLPEHYFDLSFVVDKHGPEGFGPFIAALAASGLQERFGGAGKGTPSAERETQADALVKIALTAELFRTPGGQLYARMPVNAHHEVMALEERGSGFQRWLIGQFYAQTGRSPSTSAVAQAVELTRAKAQFDSPVHEVWTRVAWTDDAIYLDLANEAWEAVKVTTEGWELVTQPPVYFRRPRGMLPLPHPDREGTMQALHDLTTVEAGSDDEKLIDAWLLQTLMPEGPYTDLCLHGEQGSTKSVLTKILRQTTDPNKAPARRAPKDEHDLVIAAQNARIVALENLSHLPDWLSDALCCLSTGAGFSTRALYTDAEEVIFTAKRPVIMNGIAEVAVRGDLIDRCLFVTLPHLNDVDVKEEKQIWQDFAEAHPRILGAILNATSMALKNRLQTTIDRLPRMADFTLWVEAAAPAFGWQPGEFLGAYRRNHKSATTTALEASVVARALLTYLDGGKTTVERMLMGELLDALTAKTFDDSKKPPPKDWPRSPQALSWALRRLAPALRTQGIEVTIHPNKKRGTEVSIMQTSPQDDGEPGGKPPTKGVKFTTPQGGLPPGSPPSNSLKGHDIMQEGGKRGKPSSISSVHKEEKSENQEEGIPLKKEVGKSSPPLPPLPPRRKKQEPWPYGPPPTPGSAPSNGRRPPGRWSREILGV